MRLFNRRKWNIVLDSVFLFEDFVSQKADSENSNERNQPETGCQDEIPKGRIHEAQKDKKAHDPCNRLYPEIIFSATRHILSLFRKQELGRKQRCEIILARRRISPSCVIFLPKFFGCCGSSRFLFSHAWVTAFALVQRTRLHSHERGDPASCSLASIIEAFQSAPRSHERGDCGPPFRLSRKHFLSPFRQPANPSRKHMFCFVKERWKISIIIAIS